MLLPDPLSFPSSEDAFSLPPSSSSSQETVQNQGPNRTSSASSVIQFDGPAPSPFAVRSTSTPAIPITLTAPAPVSALVPVPTQPMQPPAPPLSQSQPILPIPAFTSNALFSQQPPIMIPYQTTVTHNTPMPTPLPLKPYKPVLASRSDLTYDSFWSSHTSATQSYRHLLAGKSGANGAGFSPDVGVPSGSGSGASASSS